jgi:hypothetical protein
MMPNVAAFKVIATTTNKPTRAIVINIHDALDTIARD